MNGSRQNNFKKMKRKQTSKRKAPAKKQKEYENDSDTSLEGLYILGVLEDSDDEFTPIEKHFPIDMVKAIFEFLNSPVILKCALVCKDWLRATMEFSPIKGHTVTISRRHLLYATEEKVEKEMKILAQLVDSGRLSCVYEVRFVNDSYLAGLFVTEHLPKLSSVRSLILNGSGHFGLDALAKNSKLEKVSFPFTIVAWREIEKLTKGKMSSLRELCFAENSLKEIGVRKLSSGNLNNLEVLSLCDCSVPYSSTELLANHFKVLQTLDLSYNQIRAEGIRPIAKMASLTKLHLFKCRIGDEGVEYIANGNLTNLTYLDLDYNCITDASSVVLMNGNLKSLKVGNFVTMLFMNIT